MKVDHLHIRDITLTETFIEEWEALEDIQILKAVDKIIRLISTTGRIPNSFQVHKVEGTEKTFWIGYVTLGNQAWRILFSLQKKDVLQFEHILSHVEMERILAKLE